MNEQLVKRHRFLNIAQTVFLLGAIAGVLAGAGWAIAGPTGVLWTVAVGAVIVVPQLSISPALVLRSYRAEPLPLAAAPTLHRMVHRLAERAELHAVPALYLIPSPTPNALAVGGRKDPALAVTVGLLQRMSMREMVGILAHEISHLRANDTFVMTLSAAATRLLSTMSTVGLILAFLNLPLLLSGESPISWLGVLLLVVGPHLAALLHLALSRTREFDADLGAARLTGDPEGLAMALDRLQRPEPNLFERLLGIRPARRQEEDGAMLSSHPATQERVERLLSLNLPPDRFPPLPRPPADPPPRRRAARWVA